jgi:hypothetical protein
MTLQIEHFKSGAKFDGPVTLPYVEFVDQTAPANPAAGLSRLYRSSADNRIHLIDSAGTDWLGGIILPGTADGVAAMGLVNVGADDDATGILIKATDASWGEIGVTSPGGDPDYGKGQVFAYHRYLSGSTDPNDTLLFRIDKHGGMGMGGGMHLATGLRQDVGFTANQCLWVDPAVNAVGIVIHNPSTTDVPLDANWTAAWLSCYDVRNSYEPFAVSKAAIYARHTGGFSQTGGWAAFGGTFGNIAVGIFPPVATTVGLVIRGFTAQTADLQQWQSVTPATLAKMDFAGNLWLMASTGSLLSRFVASQGNAGPYMDLSASGTGITVLNRTTASLIPFTVKGMASQTGDLQQWQDSASAVIARIAADGAFTMAGKTGATTAPLTLGGTTASGPPSTGAHVTGEVVFSADGKVHFCTAAGTPGTWTTIDPSDLAAAWATWGGKEVVHTHGNTGSTETINLLLGNYHIVTQDQACTYTFTQATNGEACSFTLQFTATPVGAVTWPASVKWPDATAPTLTGVSILSFVTTDGGTTWYGFPAGKAFA